MAYAPDQLVSLHGRRLGLTKNDHLVSPEGDWVARRTHFANTVASSAVSGTATETAFDQKFTVKANTMRAGMVINVKFQGIATAQNSTDTLAIKLYLGGLGGTALLTLAARDVGTNDIFVGEATIVIRTVGSSGTFVAMGRAPANPNADGTAINMYHTGSTAIDTTADKDITVSATWSTTNAGNSCRLDILTVEMA